MRRFVVSHLASATGGVAAAASNLAAFRAATDAQLLVAGGVSSTADLETLRAAGVDGVLVGEALLSGAISLPEAIRMAA